MTRRQRFVVWFDRALAVLIAIPAIRADVRVVLGDLPPWLAIPVAVGSLAFAARVLTAWMAKRHGGIPRPARPVFLTNRDCGDESDAREKGGV